MKKKLEADLISIAHRILKLKNKSDINQLYLETQKLYEKLAVLKFVDENFDSLKPTINHSEITSEIETIFKKEEIVPAEVKIEEPIAVEETVTETIIAEETKTEEVIEETVPEIIAEISEEVILETEIETIPETVAEINEEPEAEEIEEPIFEAKKDIAAADELSFTTISDLKPIPDFIPAFELETEEIVAEIKEEPKIETETKSQAVHMTLEELLGVNYADAQFVKVDSFENVSANTTNTESKEKKAVETAVLETPAEPKTVTLNEKLAKGFHVDLNDRIAFTKNLFGNSSEDYSRVLNQLLTFDSYAEAKEFIDDMVKPDYNNWDGKDDYAERFLGIIEKKFA
ncbi:hypothetical protein B0A75_11020 [Flavobacterium oncorhynchi]|uniref:Uncharacterized protein n=1 Tax=Flavobacterium oncorhynchi TaxID=728056 RepID=A0A226HZL6_9FLAO|nr:hypothetical protein [Flavobacterium oncorhynchi]OXA99663.1 hypothetical protein B0A75_11020 [Flavobacterium oncorhynchi]